MKMKLADQNAALLPLTPTGTASALLVRAPLITAALRGYFEMLWEKATPVSAGRPATALGAAASRAADGAGADGRRPARRRDRPPRPPQHHHRPPPHRSHHETPRRHHQIRRGRRGPAPRLDRLKHGHDRPSPGAAPVRSRSASTWGLPFGPDGRRGQRPVSRPPPAPSPSAGPRSNRILTRRTGPGSGTAPRPRGAPASPRSSPASGHPSPTRRSRPPPAPAPPTRRHARPAEPWAHRRHHLPDQLITQLRLPAVTGKTRSLRRPDIPHRGLHVHARTSRRRALARPAQPRPQDLFHLCHQNLPERHPLPSLQVRNEPEDHSRVVHQLANQVVPSPWQQPSAGGPMLMADERAGGDPRTPRPDHHARAQGAARRRLLLRRNLLGAQVGEPAARVAAGQGSAGPWRWPGGRSGGLVGAGADGMGRHHGRQPRRCWITYSGKRGKAGPAITRRARAGSSTRRRRRR